MSGTTPDGEARSKRSERPRASQEERSAAMRERLLDATIDCLVDLGHARTSTVEVTERAGVSRGAMLHHFPSRADLMAAAVDRLASRRIAEFVASVTRVGETDDIVGLAIDLLWVHFTAPTFTAVLELTIVARTDTELAEVLHPLVRRYDAVIARTASMLFGKLAQTPDAFERIRRHVYFVMHGLALKAATGGDEDEIEATRAELKEELRGRMRPNAREAIPRKAP